MTETRNAIDDIWGPRTPHVAGAWPARVDERTLATVEQWVPSVCVLCSTGCGMRRRKTALRAGRLRPR
jgi:anaerobic selenocysteine-containing dehydrogenase